MLNTAGSSRVMATSRKEANRDLNAADDSLNTTIRNLQGELNATAVQSSAKEDYEKSFKNPSDELQLHFRILSIYDI